MYYIFKMTLISKHIGTNRYSDGYGNKQSNSFIFNT